jgi:ATP-dependent Lhr-like helicase
MTELSRRQFREIARVAGLVLQNIPGHPKSARQLQSSSGLIYDVFRRYEPANLLLRQAETEVLERNFEETRLIRTLKSLSEKPLKKVNLERPSPLSFPLILERLGATLSNESLVERVKKMREQWIQPAS